MPSHAPLASPRPPPDLGLQIVLWTSWILVVVGFAYLQWHGAMSVPQRVDVIGLVLRTLLVGLVGLIVLTLIEMRLEPERFGAHE